MDKVHLEEKKKNIQIIIEKLKNINNHKNLK